MKESFNVKGKSGSIAIFVLVGLLFMSSFLIVSYAYNVNKSKVAKEQFDIISDIYSRKDGDANAYERAYTALRKKNKQTLNAYVEDSSTLELNRTYEDDLVNYRIYGNSEVVEGNQTITDFTNKGFLPSSGTYPTTDTRFPNATYEVINIKKGQTFKFDYTGTNESAGEYTTIGYIRVRCIDLITNEVVCDLVHNSGESVTETDYYTTTLYYTYSAQQTDEIDGYVTAKKDFKLGIMYLLDKPDEFNLEIDTTETLGVGDRVNLLNNKNLLVTTNSNEKWEITETGIKQSKLYTGGYQPKILYDITDVLKPNTTYYVHADIIRNYECTSNIANQISGCLRVYIDDNRVMDIYTLNKTGSGSFTTPESFSSVQIKTYTVERDEGIADFDETKTYYFEWKNLYMSEIEYSEYVPHEKFRIPLKVDGRSKNLLNLSMVQNGTVNAANGQDYSQTNRCRTGYMYLEAGNYVISSTRGVRCAGNFHKYRGETQSSWLGVLTITRETDGDKTIGYVTLDEPCYVRFAFLPVNENEITDLSIDNISKYQPQLEMNTEATSYEPSNKKGKYIIMLDESLKDGEYIDFRSGKVVRNDGTEENVDLPEISVLEDYTEIEVLTEIKPSRIELEYIGYTLE